MQLLPIVGILQLWGKHGGGWREQEFESPADADRAPLWKGGCDYTIAPALDLPLCEASSFLGAWSTTVELATRSDWGKYESCLLLVQKNIKPWSFTLVFQKNHKKPNPTNKK